MERSARKLATPGHTPRNTSTPMIDPTSCSSRETVIITWMATSHAVTTERQRVNDTGIETMAEVSQSNNLRIYSGNVRVVQ